MSDSSGGIQRSLSDPHAATGDQQLDSLVQSFVAELTQLVRLAALEAVHEALGGGVLATLS